MAFLLTASVPLRADPNRPTLPMPELGADGLYAQVWLYKSSLDLRADLKASEKAGRRLAILWDQKDCGYCKTMHQVNLRIPRIIGKVTSGFNVVRLNIWGKRKVTDLDGSVVSEEELAVRNRISFAPALQFFPASLEKAAGKSLKDAEVFRSEGYFKPFHFNFLFHYVESKGYESEPNFQRWLGNIGRGLQAQGLHVDLWADALPADLPKKY
jgi:thioredoxin-related protein